MNIYQKNALMSVIVVAIAALALASGQIDSEMGDIPWKIIALFVIVSLFCAFYLRFKAEKASVKEVKKKNSAK